MGDTLSRTTTEAVTRVHCETARDMGTVRTHGQMGAGTQANGSLMKSMGTARSQGSAGTPGRVIGSLANLRARRSPIRHHLYDIPTIYLNLKHVTNEICTNILHIIHDTQTT